MELKLVNIGLGNIIMANKMVAAVNPESAPIKRLVREAREDGRLVDATCGRQTRGVVIMDSGQIILSPLQPETIGKRIADSFEADLKQRDDE